MERCTPNKQILESPFPKGSEDVAFKETQDSATVVKANAVVLSRQSEVLASQIYPLSEGLAIPMSSWIGLKLQKMRRLLRLL